MRAARLPALAGLLSRALATSALTAGSALSSSPARAAGIAMPTKYQPTGKPPGRPAKPAAESIPDIRAIFANTTIDRRSVPLVNICPDCYPDGWPEGHRVLGCQHGTWVRR